MAIDPVPWFIGGGAQHSPEVARLFTYAATSGANGIVNVGDLKVQPLNVPGGAVRVAPGAALIRNRATNAARQTYVGRGQSETEVEIAATGSSGKRSDLVVMQVEDPYVAGEPWQDPEDPAVGPYLFLRVISNVPATTTRLQDIPAYAGRSAVTLARIDIPANTGTITADMITDLREVALPRYTSRMFTVNPTDNRNLTSTSYVAWPVVGQDSTGLFDTIDIPEWATVAQILVTYTAVRTRADTYGDLRLLLGNTPNQIETVGSFNTVNSSASEVLNTFHSAIARIAVPAAIRGTTQPMRLQGRRAASGIPTNAGPLSTPDTRVVIQIELAERAA